MDDSLSKHIVSPSHCWGHPVLQGVGRDPVGALQEDGLPVDPEIEAQPGRASDWFLNKLHSPEVHLPIGQGNRTLSDAADEGKTHFRLTFIHLVDAFLKSKVT